MTRSSDLRARWTALTVAVLCLATWLGNAAHVALAPHGHHDVGFVHEHEHEHEHAAEERASSAHGEDRDVEQHSHPDGHDADDHRLAEARRVQHSHLLALPELEAAPVLLVTPPAGRAARPPALDEDPPDPAPPSGALRLRAPPVG